MVTREDLAYAAGIIDGEGTISIHKYAYHGRLPDNYQIHVRVNTVDDIICPWLHRTFGGNFCKHWNGRLTNKECRIWTVTSREAENFLWLVLPWLKLKKSQAQLALQFRTTTAEPGHYIGNAVREQRRQMYEAMKALKVI